MVSIKKKDVTLVASVAGPSAAPLPTQVHVSALPIQSAASIGPNPFWRHELGLTRPRVSFQPNTVFVIMAFSGKGMQNVYAIINAECAKIGLKANRVDNSPGSGLIIKSVVESIEAAEFIVCDLSHQRPNVYYELGYAHGVGNLNSNVLLIARRGTKPHFDIGGLRVNYYDSPKSLRAAIGSGLTIMKGLARSRAFDPAAMSAAEWLIANAGISPSAATSRRRSGGQPLKARQESRTGGKRTQKPRK